MTVMINALLDLINANLLVVANVVNGYMNILISKIPKYYLV